MQDHRYPEECRQAECERRLRRMGYVDDSGDSGVCDPGRWACMAARGEDRVEAENQRTPKISAN